MTDGRRRVGRRRRVLDPELAAALAAAPAMSASILPEHIALVRSRGALAQQSPTDEVLRHDGSVEITERRIVIGSDGSDRPLLVLRPAFGEGPWPGLYYIHGGGMIFGDNRTGIGLLLDWVVELGLVVMSLDYRLAPEHPHPSPIDDCYAGFCWVASHAPELHVDAGPLLIAGSSAGGGLAAGVSLLARDRGGPAISDQILLAPMLDDRNATPSSHELDGDGVWDRRSNLTGWEALLGVARGGPGVSPYAAPARAEDLRDLPATYLDVGSVETFRDEVLDFASRLAWAEVPVELHVWGGAFHGFDLLAPDTAVASAAQTTRLEYVRRRLRYRATA